ncbi:DNA primase [Streptomyces sp. NPDC006385]|uniref:DNA primase n=1 Tax=Streptomyces sp. NPDC006385 TaxID=3156761 RepID=UPI0033B08577
MNRVGLGLAVGAGYVLGRAKKMKLAFAVGTLVAGRRMRLSPRALADLVSRQLRNNPQFKEIGDQLREDLRGVGTAASGAMVERRLDALADRLHERTAQVRDQLAGVAPQTDRGADDEGAEGAEEEPPRKAAKKAPAKKDAAKKAPAKRDAAGKPTAKKAAEKKPAAKRTPTKKAAAKRTAAQKTAAKKAADRKPAGKKTTAARGAARSARTRLPKGGDER